MTDDTRFDFWYAINNTEVVLSPRKQLETFGTTVVDYHLVSETMDRADQVRVREGRVQAYRPEIITPQSFLETALEGFSENQSSDYMNWLREHADDLLILKYGFKIRKEVTSENIVTDAMATVVERVKKDIEAGGKPHAALLVGVDEPWEVCLLKLMVELVQQSGPGHARDLRTDPQGHRHEIEAAFREASRNKELIPALAQRLKELRLFGDYEDRFYALVRSSR